jgi:S-disulfanyl-L-cysteine oxidoreductase SoxD
VKKRFWLDLLGLALVLILPVAAACTGSSTPTPSPSASTTPIVAPPVTPTPAGSPATGPGAPGNYGTYGFGRNATSADISAWDIDISPDGTGLPPGSGTPAQGAAVFANKCAVCHGDKGQGGTGQTTEVLVGTQSWFQLGNPKAASQATIGNYWPYATTVYDYVRRAMPFTAPESLTNDEVYQVVAWLLNQNKIIGDNDVMNAQTLPKVQMPNRDGFVPDPRPWPEVQ